MYLNTDKDYFAITVIKVNCDSLCTSCKTSCNVLSHSHVINEGLDQIKYCTYREVGVGVRVQGGGGGGCNAEERVSRFKISRGWHL